uniref:Uncharacterized protein n=1 Tax=Lotus japonicus TaxID=34305 RepID=I3SV00_LOTJA|nr:unknown [Lotus japonicus]
MFPSFQPSMSSTPLQCEKSSRFCVRH